jgi:Mg-chelatase subunit ChlD
MSSPDPIDIVFSFDTTGSMYPCLSQVRSTIASTVKQLFKDVPGIRIGVIAHGDYCDAPPRGSYVIKMLDLTTNEDEIIKFVQKVEPTGGGDAPECYELVLHEARRLTWSAGKQKVLVLIGDATPHPPTYPDNVKRLDWRNEIGLLREAGIHVYGVQALNRSESTSFYREIAKGSGGLHLNLNQFRQVVDLIMAICYKQAGEDRLIRFRDHVQEAGRMNRDMAQIFGVLTGREVKVEFGTPKDLKPVPPGRFQIFKVDKDSGIKEFAESMGAAFAKGRGFYEFTKSVLVQEHKEVILEHKVSGDLFSGEQARNMIGLPFGTRGNVNPKDAKLEDYNIFIQSTSANRKLLSGTRFLYEVEDWSSAA